MSGFQGEVCCTHMPAPKGKTGAPAPCSGGGGVIAAGTLAAAIAHIGGTYTIPWWGEKWTENLRNAGYVIGFKDVLNPMRHWHLDWDGTKGLHINWEDKTNVPATKVYHKITNLAVALVPAVQITNNAVDDQPIALPSADCSGQVNQHMLWIAWSRAALAANQVPGIPEKAAICKARLGHHDASCWPQIEGFINDDYQPWLNEK